eukprot:707408_1
MSLMTLSVFCTCFIVMLHAAVSASYNCTQQQDIDYYQPNNPSAPCDTAADCCKMCFERATCNYWTLYDGQCYFKATNQGEQQSSGRISGHCLGKNNSEPDTYILDFNTSNNPLNIKVIQPYNLNYFMLIGDWGAPYGEATYASVQKAVAQKMLSYYNSQKAKGYNLLFIAALGDNFYWTGQDKTEWVPHWQDFYGELATDIPWLAVMGNHDWGNSDPTALCAWYYARYKSPAGIPYASNQLNQDKGGSNPPNYYMPDFGYFYRIDELDFELIAVEENASDCPGGLGGNGPSGGASQLFADCGGSTSIGCGYLNKIKVASENMMIQRAKTSTNKNFVITQHYPGVGQNLLKTFLSNNNHSTELVVSAYGHAHEQTCAGSINTEYGYLCNVILSGGGGGCCSESTPRGFFVLGFDENKHMVQPMKIDDPTLVCHYPCGAEVDEKEVERMR